MGNPIQETQPQKPSVKKKNKPPSLCGPRLLFSFSEVSFCSVVTVAGGRLALPPGPGWPDLHLERLVPFSFLREPNMVLLLHTHAVHWLCLCSPLHLTVRRQQLCPWCCSPGQHKVWQVPNWTPSSFLAHLAHRSYCSRAQICSYRPSTEIHSASAQLRIP